jgi:hypothetical protein
MIDWTTRDVHEGKCNVVIGTSQSECADRLGLRLYIDTATLYRGRYAGRLYRTREGVRAACEDGDLLRVVR